ncbi:hypothetical protein P9E76_15355 [Schinkia azotoformans]|uniref:Uncharacterized protein n=1 Tax=Schinkia azotoformans LMG 9581 TaxID=1131731 RepID=K6DIE2_SCHAZ|nr:hypothetical protein [Schinkia azotoformans]EKN68049.1 hypothetical protein BAZO_06014 [Schinkia azotoformans LMG 9581]MEC1638145.1 hypothetical protein [Schinkia azotoformans]MEC1946421.1 hypothetical protein [Schinkia azotoformans]
MRAEVDVIRMGNYKFVMELDTGGDPDIPYTLWIYHNRKPLYYANEYGRQVHKEFQKNYSKAHLKNFCNKFVNDAEYRISIVGKEKINASLAYKIAENFIFSDSELAESYIKFLKGLKHAPDGDEHAKEIDIILAEYGEDDLSYDLREKENKAQGIW